MVDKPEAQQVSCRGCRHYRITWDPRLPYGCAALGFKSRQTPSVVVYESSGMPCHAFAPKEVTAPG